jgi:hypothetical protein
MKIWPMRFLWMKSVKWSGAIAPYVRPCMGQLMAASSEKMAVHQKDQHGGSHKEGSAWRIA